MKKSNHACPLFQMSSIIPEDSVKNCGNCAAYNLSGATPSDKSCLRHEELLKWIHEHPSGYCS